MNMTRLRMNIILKIYLCFWIYIISIFILLIKMTIIHLIKIVIIIIPTIIIYIFVINAVFLEIIVMINPPMIIYICILFWIQKEKSLTIPIAPIDFNHILQHYQKKFQDVLSGIGGLSKMLFLATRIINTLIPG